MITGQYKTVCLYQYGGCAVNCSTVIDFNDDEIEIRDRHGNILKLSKDEWKDIEKNVRNMNTITERISSKLSLSSNEQIQLLDFIKDDEFK